VNEFEFIRERLAPLARAASGARGLIDDAATLAAPPGCELVITADTLIAGVHFRPEDPLDEVAGKALRVNLSDLAAKGADALGYLLCVTWPADLPLAEKERFVAGLARDQAQLGVSLLGGDTTVAPGPLIVSITALGTVPVGRFVTRSGARSGDSVFVTGTIGDAALGLLELQGRIGDLSDFFRDHVARRYATPRPRLSAARALRESARAAIDISDGLIADAGHVARASGVRIAIEAAKAPLSVAARAWLDSQPDYAAAIATLLTGGDDYEILFCASESVGDAVSAASGVRVTQIGWVERGAGVLLLDREGGVIPVERPGFTHF
jgi:thiamine-monophosphate kinase